MYFNLDESNQRTHNNDVIMPTVMRHIIPRIGITDRITGLVYGHRDYIAPSPNIYSGMSSVIVNNTGVSAAVKNYPKPKLGIISGINTTFKIRAL